MTKREDEATAGPADGGEVERLQPPAGPEAPRVEVDTERELSPALLGEQAPLALAPGDAAEGHDESDHHCPGTVVLTLVFLLSFAVYYFANWKALADVWHVR